MAAAAALRVGFLYVAPFGRCPKCKGRRRIQRTGSRTVHRLVFKIRHGREVAARYQQREDRP